MWRVEIEKIEEIIMKVSPNLMKNINPEIQEPHKPQAQETQWKLYQGKSCSNCLKLVIDRNLTNIPKKKWYYIPRNKES